MIKASQMKKRVERKKRDHLDMWTDFYQTFSWRWNTAKGHSCQLLTKKRLFITLFYMCWRFTQAGYWKTLIKVSCFDAIGVLCIRAHGQQIFSSRSLRKTGRMTKLGLRLYPSLLGSHISHTSNGSKKSLCPSPLCVTLLKNIPVSLLDTRSILAMMSV